MPGLSGSSTRRYLIFRTNTCKAGRFGIFFAVKRRTRTLTRFFLRRELIRDVERIFSYQFNMTTDEGGFRFSDNDTVNRTFLEMFNRGAAMGAKNSDAVRNVAGEAGFTDNSDGNASAADVTAAVAESINAAAGSKTDEAASEIREKTGAERNAAIKAKPASAWTRSLKNRAEKRRRRFLTIFARRLRNRV